MAFKVGRDWGAPYSSYEAPPPAKEDTGSESTPIGEILGLTKWEDRCVGVILSSMIGDILGAPVEGSRPSQIRGKYGTLRDFVKGKPLGIDEERCGMYTDDTNSTLAAACSLVNQSGLDAEDMALENCRFYLHIPTRGYSDHSVATIKALLNNESDYRTSGTALLEKGSWANGGAMKISPVGIAFRNSDDEVLHTAVRLAILSTHTHKEGIDGAWVQAKAITVLLKEEPATFNPMALLEHTLNCAKTDKMKLQIKNVIRHIQLGSGAEAVSCTIMNAVPEIGTFFQVRASQAVPCALWALAKYSTQPEEGIIQAVNMGGDADTIGTIAGALFGALHGTRWIPTRWFDNIENGPYGRDYAINLAKQLSTLDLDIQHIVPINL